MTIRLKERQLTGYVLAFVAVATATLFRLALDPLVHDRHVFEAYYMAFTALALVASLRAVLLAMFLGYLVGEHLFVLPRGDWVFLNPTIDHFGMALLYFTVCGTLTALVAATRRAQSRAEASRSDLARHEERLRIAIETAQMGTWDIEVPSGRVQESERVGPMFGRPRGWSHGHIDPFIASIHPEDRARVVDAIRDTIARGATYHSEFRVVGADGKTRWLESAGVGLRDEDGDIQRVIGCVFEITSRRDAERALRDADQRKDEFLAMLAHELRNPLAPIRNAVTLLGLLGPPEPKLQKLRNIIDRQVGHVSRLVEDLLDVSRITSGKIQLRCARVTLAEIFDQAVETERPMLEAHGHTLEVSLPPADVYLDADNARLVQVVANLLNNAAKYTDPGGRILLAAECRDRRVRIRCQDNGCGIRPELLPRIFDLFTQDATGLDRQQGGLGIGLTLVKRLVEMHGGEIEARSPGPGKGSEFVVTLPLADPVSEEVMPLVDVTQARRGLSILIVEDSVDSAESLAMLLEAVGHSVRIAHTGVAALNLANAFVPDVAFIDIGLPELDGYEVAQRLRGLPSWGATTLVALSGYGRPEDVERAIRSGFDRHLTKPAGIKALSEVLTGTGRMPARSSRAIH